VRRAAHHPSGASTGIHEAVELRDGGDGSAARASSRRQQVNGEIADALDSIDALDSERSTGPDRPRRVAGQGRLGANAMLAVSWRSPGPPPRSSSSALRLHRWRQCHVLPVPQFNVINAGARGQLHRLQEFMIMPWVLRPSRGAALGARPTTPEGRAAEAGLSTAVVTRRFARTWPHEDAGRRPARGHRGGAARR